VAATNYTGFTNFNVFGPPGGGTVDLVRGASCQSGAGGCVDLDGNTNSAGGLRTKVSYAFNAGDKVTLSFDFSGNAASAADNSVFFGFEALGSTNFLNALLSNSGGSLPLGDVLGQTSLVFGYDGILSTDPYDRMFFSFTAGNSGSIFAVLGDATASPASPSTDNRGALIDNFQLSFDAPVPEPATWLTMIAGFFATGGALRRRQMQALRISYR
jgi:hypothetical protein